MTRPAPRIMRAPLVHFFAIGAALAFTRTRLPAIHPDAAHTIVVTPEIVDRLKAATGAAADAPLDQAPLERWLDDEVLYREGIRRGLSKNPASIARLLQVGRFVGPDGCDEDTLAEADRLGFGEHDPVIRAQVVAWMRLRLRTESTRQPTEDELRNYLTAHAERYATPARTTFTHVFIRRDPDGQRRAETLADRLRRGALGPRQAIALGDLFRDGDRFVSYALPDVAAALGPAVATAIATAPEHAWSNPVQSPYGWHLLWIETRTRTTAPPLDTVRERVQRAWRVDHAHQAVDERVRALRAVYRVAFDPAARSDS